MDAYAADSGAYPDRLEDLLETIEESGEPVLQRIPLDAWGNAFRYVLRADGYPEVTSLGGDGLPGGEGKAEDISSVTEGLIPPAGG